MTRKLNATSARNRAKDRQEEAPEGEEAEAEDAEAENAPKSNVTDETVLTCTQEAVAAYDAMAAMQDKVTKLRGKYRAKLKDAKALGVDPDAIRAYIKDRERDPLEVDRELRDRMRVARLMGLPIGTQLSIFENGASPASHVDTAEISKRLVKEAAKLGKKHGSEGKEHNGGNFGTNQAASEAYDAAYKKAQAKNAAGIQKGGDEAKQ